MHADMQVIVDKISHCSKELDVQSKEKFGSMWQQIQEAKKNLIKLQQSNSRDLKLQEQN